MTLAEYQSHLESLPFGKRLPTAVYVFRDEGASFGADWDRLVAQIVAAFQVAPKFNVIKLRTDELKISFLAYPDFLRHLHPVRAR